MNWLEPEVNETIPAVSMNDLKAVLEFIHETTARNPRTKAFGIDLIRTICSAGANVEAVVWRIQHLELATMVGTEFAPFVCDGQPNEKLIQLFATFPFRVVAKDGSSYKLNSEEFEAEFRKLQ